VWQAARKHDGVERSQTDLNVSQQLCALLQKKKKDS